MLVVPDGVLGDLIRARALIAEPKNWCRGRTARTAGGAACSTASQQAARFCAMGALLRATGEAAAPITAGEYIPRRTTAAGERLADALCHMGCRYGGVNSGVKVAYYNDMAGHAAVLAMFDRAIAMAANEHEPDKAIALAAAEGFGEPAPAGALVEETV